ncbi:MAG: hypothetical protein IJ711_07890 [Lachnospiraceae bacterium]|nr:hypothetical protein [Lachnospiraceae bacterium]
MKKQVSKGSFGYIKQRRTTTILWTLLLFAVSAALFITGIVATGTKKNLLTIVAVLGVLPAARSLVNAFMYCKAKGCSGEWYEAHKEMLAGLTHHFYDLVFTTYERTYNVPALVIREGNICGLCLDEKKPLKELEEHIQACLKKENLHANVTVFPMDKAEEFLHRVSQLTKLEQKEKNRDGDMARILFEITL